MQCQSGCWTVQRSDGEASCYTDPHIKWPLPHHANQMAKS